jgi:hypothetical protein
LLLLRRGRGHERGCAHVDSRSASNEERHGSRNRFSKEKATTVESFRNEFLFDRDVVPQTPAGLLERLSDGLSFDEPALRGKNLTGNRSSKNRTVDNCYPREAIGLKEAWSLSAT